jgi:hypothetical protein
VRRRDLGKEPIEGDVLEGVRGERRTVLAVRLVNRQTIVTYLCSHDPADPKDIGIEAWARWVIEHEARLVTPVD